MYFHGDANGGHLLHLLIVVCFMVCSYGSDYDQDFIATRSHRNVQIHEQGVLSLCLDKEIGSRIESKQKYIYRRSHLEMKLANGESAGTVTSFYICTGSLNHDEVGFEFVGNTSGQSYILHTNFFINGTGSKEQQFLLWFDATEDFHTYSILWNPINIILFIDGIKAASIEPHRVSGALAPFFSPEQQQEALRSDTTRPFHLLQTFTLPPRVSARAALPNPTLIRDSGFDPFFCDVIWFGLVPGM